MKLINKKNGIYTIEAIIAIIVFLIGVIAIQNIQTNSISATSQSQYRIIATSLADALIGQIWVDRNNALSYASGIAGNNNQFIMEWNSAVREFLPGSVQNPPRIIVEEEDGFFEVSVQIFWLDKNTRAISNHSITTSIYGADD